MDEVDGMGAGDRSGMSELIQMIKKSKTPIICICNDRQSQKLKSLLPYCMDLKYVRPNKMSLANRAIRIAESEGLSVERNAAEAIAESCGNDVRQVLNLLQMWAQKKDADDGSLTYKNYKDRGKSIQKDEMLRVSLFDAAKLIVEGPRDLQDADPKVKLGSLFKRSDAFFVDYSFTGLIVQQNYPKVTNSQFQKIKGNEIAELDVLERFHRAADSMSDYDLAESQIRGGSLNWSLLPTTAMLTVKTGFHAGGDTGGFLGGYPEFTAWMGKNSSMGKNYRLLNEVHHHMNYKVSANAQELRRTYVPVLRERLFRLITQASSESNQEAIDLMDDYGLSRDDIVEKLDALVLGKKDFSFDDLDSKQKTAFTKQYNAGVHKSQALVREQGGGGTVSRKKKKVISMDEEDEEGAGGSDSEQEIDEEKELERLQAQFKKKGRRKAAPKKKGKGKKK
jgi:replication factor C subunit 1